MTMNIKYITFNYEKFNSLTVCMCGVHYPLLLNSDPSSQLSPCIFHRLQMTRVHISITDLTATASLVLTGGERLCWETEELEGEEGW